ncbi:hypothetical protein B0H13DRAFT_2002039, partial [Mycena leptocephala]
RSWHVVAGGRASAMGAARETYSACARPNRHLIHHPGRRGRCRRCHNASTVSGARTRTQGWVCMQGKHASMHIMPCTQLGSAPRAWPVYLRCQLTDLAVAQGRTAERSRVVQRGDGPSVIPFQQMGSSQTPGEAIRQRLLYVAAHRRGDGAHSRVGSSRTALKIEGRNAVHQESLCHSRAIQSGGDKEQRRK